MKIILTDGGRAAAGFTSNARDCVARAVAIASGRPYAEVYAALAAGNASQRGSTNGRTARSGIHTKRKWFHDYMTALGFRWVSCMHIGSGCKVHLRAEELPEGRLVVSLSRHMAAVVDGVLHDNHDCSRGGSRCVYGYYTL